MLQNIYVTFGRTSERDQSLFVDVRKEIWNSFELNSTEENQAETK
jgi:hypothetical protein